jgi:hypothetical protein
MITMGSASRATRQPEGARPINKAIKMRSVVIRDRRVIENSVVWMQRSCPWYFINWALVVSDIVVAKQA